MKNDAEWRALFAQATPEEREEIYRSLVSRKRYRVFARISFIPPDIAIMQAILCFGTLLVIPPTPGSSPGVVMAVAYLLSLATAIILWRLLNPPRPEAAKEQRWRSF